MDRQSVNAFGAVSLGIADQLARTMTRSTGLDPASTAALTTVLARPGTSVVDLATTLGITHSGAVRVVSKLKSASLLRRERGRDDRTAGLWLTRKGGELARKALGAREHALEALVDGLSQEAQETLNHVVSVLATRLATTQGDARHICRLCEHEICRGTDCPVGRSFKPTDDETHEAARPKT